VARQVGLDAIELAVEERPQPLDMRLKVGLDAFIIGATQRVDCVVQLQPPMVAAGRRGARARAAPTMVW